MMKTNGQALARVSFVFMVLVLLALVGCYWPGTGTINVRNTLCWGKNITALYIYETGVPDTDNEISAPLEHWDTHAEYGLAPGSWTIVAIIDGGPDYAVVDVDLAEEEWKAVWIDDYDIVD